MLETFSCVKGLTKLHITFLAELVILHGISYTSRILSQLSAPSEVQLSISRNIHAPHGRSLKGSKSSLLGA